MSLSVLVAIVGVLVAAVVTGVLIGRYIRNPALGLAAWAVGTLGLTVALLAQGIGFASGFSPLTFRVAELGAQLIAPLWLAWGLVELAARGEVARIAMRLATGALTVVAGVILATDPLAGKPSGRSWASAAAHYQLIAHYVLILVQVVAAVAVLAIAASRMARGQGDPAWRPAPAAVAAGGLAALLTIAFRFTLPVNSAYPALGAAAAALVWFAATRTSGRLQPGGSGALAGSFPAGPRGPEPPDREWRGGDPVAPGARGRRRGDEPYRPDGPGRQPGRTAGRPGMEGVPRSSREGNGYPGDTATQRIGGRGGPGRPGGYEGPGGPGAVTRALEAPGAAAVSPGLAPLPGMPGAVPGAPGMEGPEANGGRRAPRTQPYGLIAIYTLLDDRVADFDRLAAHVAEQVRGSEPDTLIYVIHTVPKAPMQRIFYEVYRDREAFEFHENQPYISRFVAERRPCVLATNVIELRLNYAKVSPLGRPRDTRASQVQQRRYDGGI